MIMVAWQERQLSAEDMAAETKAASITPATAGWKVLRSNAG